MEILAAFGNSPDIDHIRNISSVLGAEKIIIYNTGNRQMYSVPFFISRTMVQNGLNRSFNQTNPIGMTRTTATLRSFGY